jgi:DNA-binding transcriptional LysR family regulator
VSTANYAYALGAVLNVARGLLHCEMNAYVDGGPIGSVQDMRGNHFAEFTAFVAVAEHRNFTKAATQLGISTGTLSQTIRSLEEHLGVRLLNRTTRSVAPTDAGERLLTRLRPVLQEYDAALESINEFRDKPAGTVRITVAPGAHFIIAPLLPQFLAEYPDIRVDISVDSALVDIVADQFDAGIRPGHHVERDMIALRLSDDLRHSIAASPAYLARRPPPQTPKDLRAHNCIRIRLPSGAILPWRFEKDGRAFEVAVDGSLTVNEPELALRAALEGAGVLYLPVDYAAPMAAKGRLVTLLEDWMPRMSGFCLFYPSRRQNPAALQAFIDFLRAHVRTGAARSEDDRAPRPSVRQDIGAATRPNASA